MMAVLFIPYNFETNGPDSWTTAEKALYLAVEHILFSVGLVLLLMPMIAGFGGLAFKFLTNKYFSVLAKISFSYYMIHPLWIHYFLHNKHQAFYIQDGPILYQFIGTVVLTMISATIITLIIESPVLALEKKLLKRE